MMRVKKLGKLNFMEDKKKLPSSASFRSPRSDLFRKVKPRIIISGVNTAIL